MKEFARRVNTPEKREKYNRYQREYARRRKHDEAFRKRRSELTLAYLRRKKKRDEGTSFCSTCAIMHSENN